MTTIYAIKAPEKEVYINKVFLSLQAGEGRFGWSYISTADQRSLNKRCETDGWNSLTLKEQDCYHDFLLEISQNDYVVYINVPSWGSCTLAKVTSEYEFQYEDDDFNHRFKVDPNSVKTFDRNDGRVHPALSARLKLQGRWWRVSTVKEFKQLLRALDDPQFGATTTKRNST